MKLTPRAALALLLGTVALGWLPTIVAMATAVHLGKLAPLALGGLWLALLVTLTGTLQTKRWGVKVRAAHDAWRMELALVRVDLNALRADNAALRTAIEELREVIVAHVHDGPSPSGGGRRPRTFGTTALAEDTVALAVVGRSAVPASPPAAPAVERDANETAMAELIVLDNDLRRRLGGQ